MARKRIGLITNEPDGLYQQRILEGIMTQCERYNYDVVAFMPLVDVYHQREEYRSAEFNIWNIANYDKLDGVLISSITITRNSNTDELEQIGEYVRDHCKAPIVALDLPAYKGCETVYTDDITSFRMMTSHIIDKHGCDPEKIYFLTGQKDHEISLKRVDAFREELESRGKKFDKNKVFFGDYWYPGGIALGQRIASGEVEMPQAVMCANDYMAIGLINELAKHGIDVPGQIIVTGYDATREAVLNDVIITSFVPMVSIGAQEAVNRLHQLIEPGTETIPADTVTESDICLGSSCGCRESVKYVKERLLSGEFTAYIHDYTNGFDFQAIDMSLLTNSYMLEQLTSAGSPEEVLEQIFNLTYLLRPFGHFYLCLRRDWLNTYRAQKSGYPETMRQVIHCVPLSDDADYSLPSFHIDDDSHVFETAEMLPELYIDWPEPCIFSFAPVHFQGDTLGYVVLQTALKDRVKPSSVFRNWVRNVNNALEMVRVQSKLISYSLFDSMTGLYNRRGMEISYKKLCASASEGTPFAVMVIDMNGLKGINDNYGHSEGDAAIIQLSYCVGEMVTGERIIPVRAGGDEFFVIAAGKDVTEEFTEGCRKLLHDMLDRYNSESGKEYKVTASFGSIIRPYTKGMKLEELIHIADEKMYADKKAFKSLNK